MSTKNALISAAKSPLLRQVLFASQIVVLCTTRKIKAVTIGTCLVPLLEFDYLPSETMIGLEIFETRALQLFR